jgi:hypothetical protein
MATAHTLNQSSQLGSTAKAIGHGFAYAVNSVVHFFGLLQNASVAAQEYDRLASMSDETLAAKGLSRDDIGRIVVDRL